MLLGWGFWYRGVAGAMEARGQIGAAGTACVTRQRPRPVASPFASLRRGQGRRRHRMRRAEGRATKEPARSPPSPGGGGAVRRRSRRSRHRGSPHPPPPRGVWGGTPQGAGRDAGRSPGSGGTDCRPAAGATFPAGRPRRSEANGEAFWGGRGGATPHICDGILSRFRRLRGVVTPAGGVFGPARRPDDVGSREDVRGESRAGPRGVPGGRPPRGVCPP